MQAKYIVRSASLPAK